MLERWPGCKKLEGGWIIIIMLEMWPGCKKLEGGWIL